MMEQINGLPFKVVHIPKEKTIEVFGLIEKELKKILDKADNGYNHDDIRNELSNGEMQLWIIWDIYKKETKGFIITEIIERPRLKFCSVFIMTGTERKRWQYEAMKNLIKFAKENNCRKGISYARKGWTKVFKEHGFKDTHVALEINLTNKEEK